MQVDEGAKPAAGGSKRKEEPKDKLSPAKKAAKKKATIVGKMEGPLGTRIINLGGHGDCAWRAIAYLLGQTNAKCPF